MYKFDTNGGSYLDNYKDFFSDPVFSRDFKSVGQSQYKDIYGYKSNLVNRKFDNLIYNNLSGNKTNFNYKVNTTFDDGFNGSVFSGQYKNLIGDSQQFKQLNEKLDKTNNPGELLEDMFGRMGLKVSSKELDSGINLMLRAGQLGSGTSFQKAINAGQFAIAGADLLGYKVPDSYKKGANTLGYGANALNPNAPTSSRIIDGGRGILSGSDLLGMNVNPSYGNILDIAGAGDSLYQLFDNYKYMSPGERVGATFTALNNLNKAYKGGQSLYNNSEFFGNLIDKTYNSLSGIGNSALEGVRGAALEGVRGAALDGSSSLGGQMFGQVGTFLNGVGSLHGLYQLGSTIESGNGGANGRLAGGFSGANAGSYFGPWGTAIGAVVGTGLGSIKHGNPVQEDIRNSLRRSFSDAGIFMDGGKLLEKDPTFDLKTIRDTGGEGKITKDTVVMPLADGTYSRIDYDGSKNKKFTFNNPDILPEEVKKETNGKRHFYDIDITSNFDVGASNALTALHHMMLGGSLNKDTGDKTYSEKQQLKGMMTNGILSNLENKEMSQSNFNKVMDNAKVNYERSGVKSAKDGIALLEKLVSEGKLTKDDYLSSLTSLDYVFNKNFNAFKNTKTEFDIKKGETTQASMGSINPNSKLDFEQKQEKVVNSEEKKKEDFKELAKKVKI
jgi:hypothetical protein